MLRLFLPPNLVAAAPRDAIALKVELDLASPPPAEWLPALAWLQRWSAAPTPPKFIQLTRAQLQELITALRRQPVFFWLNSPAQSIGWLNDDLVGVSEHVVPRRELETPGKSSAAPAAASTRKAPAFSGPPLSVDGSEHFLALTLPSKEHPRHAELLDLVKSHGFILEPSNRKWWLRDRHKTLNFLAAQGERLREEFDAQFTPNFTRNTAHLRPAEVVADVKDTGDGFAVTVGLRAGAADDAQLRSAVSANRGYLETNGQIILLDAKKLQRVTAAQRALAGEPAGAMSPRRTMRVSAARAAEAQEILEELSPGFQAPETWRARNEALRHVSGLAPAPLPAVLDGQLRPYQRLGVAWLWHLFRHQLGGILADEMGLGKTLQALGLLSVVRSASARASSPALVVCPASLLENWRRETVRFAPQLRPFIHHGEQRLATAADFTGVDLIITSYGTLARDRDLFAAVEFAVVVADEAQHIKNRRSQNAAALRSLRSNARFLLTGTPLENSLDDLRSLFEFLLPGYIDRVPAGTRAEERGWYDERLRAKTAPYILRRTKQSVAPELPAKLEQVIWCEFSPAQAALYRSVQEQTERELFDLEAGGASEARLRLAALTQLLRLRQICCDPRLLGENRFTTTTSPIDSTKLEAFGELLAESIDDGHRVLVFSQFTSLLALLRAELERDQVAHCYLDGSMPARARQAEVDRFQTSSDIPLFLLSLKAGGTGLNLTGADTVVHFDPWWNPAVEAQATDRAHRIGQSRVVTSYKLIVAGSVEEKVLALQDEKRALLANVFDASDAAAAKLSLADLKSLLR